MNEERWRINPDWVCHPHEVAFLFALPELRRGWSRKRRLKWTRRFIRQTQNRERYDIRFISLPGHEGKPLAHLPHGD